MILFYNIVATLFRQPCSILVLSRPYKTCYNNLVTSTSLTTFNLTLQRTTKNSLSRAGFELASLGL